MTYVLKENPIISRADGLTIKTTSQAQTIVNNAIAEYNDDLPLIGSNNDTEYGSVTLE